MLNIKDGVAEVKVKDSNELLKDVRTAMCIFVKYSKEHRIPDEVIEKTSMEMVVEAFNNLNNIVTWDKKEDDK